MDDGLGIFGWSVIIGMIVLIIAGYWKMYEKANEPGWAVLVPIYNYIVLLRIVGRPGWWFLLMLIPLVNLVIAVVVYGDLARSFGKGIGFALGLLFVGFIFVPILGFGDAQYQGPGAELTA